MNFDNSSVATVLSIDGTSFVKRNGVEVPLREEMQLQLGDVIKTTENALVVISIPGTQQQIPAFVEVSNGAVAGLGFNPDAGRDGQVVVSNIGDGLGNIVFVSEFDGENQAAVMEGQEGSEGAMAGLFGAGLLGGSMLAPVAGAVGAAALFAGLASGDDDSAQSASSGTPPIDDNGNPGGGSGGGSGGSGGGSGGDSGNGAVENAGGLSQTVGDLTNNLRDVTAPVPVVSDVVDAVGDVLDDVLTGDNNGGLGGILTGLGDGVSNGLNGTPLEPVGNVLDMVLGTVGGGLGMVADQISSLADNTPLDPLANLLGDVLGRSGPNDDGGIGGVLGTLTNVTDGLAQLLAPVPLLGELTGTLGNTVDSVVSGDNGGGLGGVLAGLGDGIETGLAGTPLSLLGEGADALLGTLGGALGGAGEQLSSFGEGTPAAGLTSLLGDLLGTASGTLATADLLGGLGSSISSNQSEGSGPFAGIPLLGDLTRNLG